MGEIIQYDLFKEKPTETEELRMEFVGLEKSLGKVRRGLFARHGELCKMQIDLMNRLEIIERHICQGK